MTVSNTQQRKHATVWDPFIGPRPFTRMIEDQKIFFGREDEADDIITLILGHKAVLVYSQSGIGKTSIFEAKIVPTLEKDYEFNVLPTARVGITSSNKFEFTPNDLSSQFLNFYMLNAFQSLIDDIDPYLVYNKSLFEFLNEYFPSDKNGNNKQKLLIFDQFEELFIFYPDDNCKKQQENFFEQVAEALERDLFLRIVFVIREDYLAELDPFVYILPEQLRPRFRLERLNKDDASLAINEPLEMAKSNIDHRVIEKLHEKKVIYKLIEDLAKIKKETFGGQSFEIKGEFIDPLQLQVVCKRLWEKLKITQINQLNDPNYFDFLGNINKALEDYYYDAIETAASSTGISQDKIRNWIETSLITSSETRGIVYRESEKTDGIPNEAIQVLAEKNLITIQNRPGGYWYELAHDRLISLIKASNVKHKQSDRRIDLYKDMESWENKNYSDSRVEKLIEGKKSKSEKNLSIEVTEVVKKLAQLKEKLRSIIEIESEHPLPFDIEESLIEESLRFASLLYYNGNYEESIKYLNNVIDIHPNNITAWVNKGFALNALKRYDEAISAFNKALELDPYYVYVWNGQGIVYTDLKRYDEALQSYDKALELDPKYTDAWYNKGLVYYYEQRYDEALQSYDKALELDPKYTDAWNSKGIAYKNSQRYDEALQSYDKALELDPYYVYALNNKGNVYYDLQRYDEALQYFDKALELDPKFVSAWLNKGNALSNLGRYEEAIDCYDKVLVVDPENVDVLYNKGFALSKLSRYEEGNWYHDKALRIDPNYISSMR